MGPETAFLESALKYCAVLVPLPAARRAHAMRVF